MIIALHVAIALASLALTTFAYFQPSAPKLKIAYGLVGLTLASGTYLTITLHTHILRSCLTGLIYLGVVITGLVAANHKFAHTKA